jgi:hypothetical protein
MLEQKIAAGRGSRRGGFQLVVSRAIIESKTCAEAQMPVPQPACYIGTLYKRNLSPDLIQGVQLDVQF